jgi:hypothetical protein
MKVVKIDAYEISKSQLYIYIYLFIFISLFIYKHTHFRIKEPRISISQADFFGSFVIKVDWMES